jgi:hypothetical protein
MSYAKGILSLLIALGTVLVTALGTSPQQNLGHLSWVDWLKVIVAFLATGAFTTWVDNIKAVVDGVPLVTVAKAVAAGLGTFCTGLITAYVDQIVTQGELIGSVTAAFVAALAVYQTPNVVTAIRARRAVVDRPQA